MKTQRVPISHHFSSIHSKGQQKPPVNFREHRVPSTIWLQGPVCSPNFTQKSRRDSDLLGRKGLMRTGEAKALQITRASPQTSNDPPRVHSMGSPAVAGDERSLSGSPSAVASATATSRSAPRPAHASKPGRNGKETCGHSDGRRPPRAPPSRSRDWTGGRGRLARPLAAGAELRPSRALGQPRSSRSSAAATRILLAPQTGRRSIPARPGSPPPWGSPSCHRGSVQSPRTPPPSSSGSWMTRPPPPPPMRRRVRESLSYGGP